MRYEEAVDTGMTCDRCGGPLLPHGNAWLEHWYDECIRWLTIRDREVPSASDVPWTSSRYCGAEETHNAHYFVESRASGHYQGFCTGNPADESGADVQTKRFGTSADIIPCGSEEPATAGDAHPNVCILLKGHDGTHVARGGAEWDPDENMEAMIDVPLEPPDVIQTILKAVEARKNDAAFMARLRESMERNKPLLDMLAADDDAGATAWNRDSIREGVMDRLNVLGSDLPRGVSMLTVGEIRLVVNLTLDELDESSSDVENNPAGVGPARHKGPQGSVERGGGDTRDSEGKVDSSPSDDVRATPRMVLPPEYDCTHPDHEHSCCDPAHAGVDGGTAEVTEPGRQEHPVDKRSIAYMTGYADGAAGAHSAGRTAYRETLERIIAVCELSPVQFVRTEQVVAVAKLAREALSNGDTA